MDYLVIFFGLLCCLFAPAGMVIMFILFAKWNRLVSKEFEKKID